MKRWVFLHPKNAQFENVSFFIKVSDEEKFLLFQHDEINDKNQRCCLIGMLDACGCGFMIISVQIGLLRYVNEGLR